MWPWSSTPSAAFLVGWQAARSLGTDLALDALEMAIWGRRAAGLDGLVHHSDRAGQYRRSATPSARRSRRGALGGLARRLVRQRPGGNDHRAVQDQADPPPRPLEGHRRGRVRHPGVGRLVQPPPAPARPLAMSRPPSSRPPTTEGRTQAASTDSSTQASTKPGALQASCGVVAGCGRSPGTQRSRWRVRGGWSSAGGPAARSASGPRTIR